MDSEPGDLPDDDVAGQGVSPKRLATREIGQVYLDRGQGDGEQGVAEGDAGVPVAGGVDDDAVAVVARGVEMLDEGAFVVALGAAQGDAVGSGGAGEGGFEVGEGAVAVQRGLSLTEQVEVGAVEQQKAKRPVGRGG